MFFWVSRSHHVLLMIPCVSGSVPVAIVAWPAHVSVVRYGYAAFGYHAPSSSSRRRPFVQWLP
jgi:hypothetical protein